MQLDTDQRYDISAIEVNDDDLLLEIDPFDEVISQSLNINPDLKGVEADLEASRFSLKEFRANRMPTISAFGRIGSNYSSNGARNPKSGEFEADASFRDQLEFNKFEYVNFSLSIPLFSQYQTSTNVQVAKVNYLNAELDRKATINTITNTVQRVYLDLVAGQQTYLSAKENMEAQNASFEFIKKRFDVGNTDFNAYLESLNNKNRAEFQLVSSKYEILFRKKILDIYRGN
jgi:outer membrane protein